jgi:hypothetical protein
MKKVIITAIAILSTFNAFTQGTVIFNNRIAGTLITHVYYSPFYRVGNSSNDTPSGTTDYTGATLLSGAGWFAQLLSANGANQPAQSLLPSSPTTTFRTGAAAGNVVGITATLGNVPPDAAAATLELVVWDNSSGLYSTWNQASVAWTAGLIFAGGSPLFNVFAIGGNQNPAPALVGLQSFSISVPEPTLISLAGLGSVLFLLRRTCLKHSLNK